MNPFTEEECRTILDNYLGRKVQYKSHSTKSLLGDVEGYLAEHYNLTINYEENNQSGSGFFFVKTIGSNDTFLGKFSVAMDVFNKESFVYTNFFPELEKLKYYKQINPKCYFSRENTLVLEDLATEGYRPGERLKYYDVDQCQKALETLAYYHAYGILYEENKSKELNRPFRLDQEYSREFQNKIAGENAQGATKQFIEAAIKSIIDLIGEIPIDVLPKKDLLLELLVKNLEHPERENKIKNKFRKTCIHGDLWANNIMFSYKNNKIDDCKLIDFQVLSYDIVGQDLELFFHYNTNKTFQLEHKEELLHYYYQCFSRMLAENGVNVTNIISFDDLKQMSTLRGPDAKVQAIADRSLLYMPDELRVQTLEDSDFMERVIVIERSKYVLEVFHNNEEYRKIVIDDMMDLQQLLEAKKELINN